MIELSSVSKYYSTSRGCKKILSDVNLRISRAEKIGILGRNGAGKSTLIRLIGGAELPTSGSVIRSMTVSWPLAFGGAFQGALTGFDNLRFVCRVYGADINRAADFVEEFSELGDYLHEPVKKYSSGMRARLAFAVSMAIDFECFLIDEVIAVGDARFHQKCEKELFEYRAGCAKIIVSHDPTYIANHCDRASVLSDGVLHHFESIPDALEYYESLG